MWLSSFLLDFPLIQCTFWSGGRKKKTMLFCIFFFISAKQNKWDHFSSKFLMIITIEIAWSCILKSCVILHTVLYKAFRRVVSNQGWNWAARKINSVKLFYMKEKAYTKPIPKLVAFFYFLPDLLAPQGTLTVGLSPPTFVRWTCHRMWEGRALTTKHP